MSSRLTHAPMGGFHCDCSVSIQAHRVMEHFSASGCGDDAFLFRFFGDSRCVPWFLFDQMLPDRGYAGCLLGASTP